MNNFIIVRTSVHIKTKKKQQQLIGMFGQNSILLNSTNRAIELGPIVNIYLIGNLVQWEKKVQWLAGGLVAQIFILWSQGKDDTFLYLYV